MGEHLLFNDFSLFLKKRFSDKIQRISIDAGFTCPNRDGTKGINGCIFCNNATFSPAYCQPNKSVTLQLEEGKRFFSRKYTKMKYLAYFQAYSNTYAPLEQLKRLYEEALLTKDILGIVIATRPDCISNELLDYLSKLQKHCFVMLEYGIESTSDKVLRGIHRGHTFNDSIDAVKKTAECGIPVTGHIILGLPEEEEMNDCAHRLSQLPLTALKIHQLQIVRNTPLASNYELEPDRFHLPTVDEYIEKLIKYIEALRPDIYLDRFVSQSPSHLLIAPRWGLKNEDFKKRLEKRMREQDTYQGRTFFTKI